MLGPILSTWQAWWYDDNDNGDDDNDDGDHDTGSSRRLLPWIPKFNYIISKSSFRLTASALEHWYINDDKRI